MSKRYYKSSTTVNALSEGMTTLPTHRPIAVYYRQSTDAQIGNISTSIQTIDMVAYLKEKGWSDEDILLIDMDAGISGTTKIDERPGMRLLFDLITQAKIGTVACQDEDRLFRDVTQIQVNIFIEACRTSKILVLTPSMVYDFANDLTGSFHARQFRFKSEMAAEYINTVIKGKLYRAKHRLLMEGRWAGFAVLPGYMVDIRKTLPDGSKNSNWKRYVPFPQYAEVVNEYFRLFLEYAGNVFATVKHIHEYGPFYPDPTTCSPPEGFRFITKMHQYARGYCPARNGLVNLLTNVLVLGHWTVNGVVVRWNNHQPIVSETVFWKAFNYLSPSTLDGHPNPHFRPFSQNSRPLLEQERPVERPLCAGMMSSRCNDTEQWRNVGTVWQKDRNEYVYNFAPPHPLEGRIWQRSAVYIDKAVVNFLHDKLRATFEPEIWEDTITNAHGEYKEERHRIQTQIATLERVMENHILSLEALTNIDMIRNVQFHYENAQAEHKRLSAQLATHTSYAQRIEILQKIKKNLTPALESWEKLTYAEKRVILQMFVQQIEAIEADGNGLQITICWIDRTKETVITLPKQMKSGWRTWLDSETTHLKTLFEQHATQIEISAAFPHRTWRMIADKLGSLYGWSEVKFSPKPILATETYPMYQERTKNQVTPYTARPADRWTTEEIERVKTLYQQSATKLDYLKAIPHRNWLGIQKKIVSVFGEDAMLPVDKTIRNTDRITDVLFRTEQTDIHLFGTPLDDTQKFSVSSESGSPPTPNPSDAPNICAPV